MGKVTYAIGFGYGSPYSKAIKRMKRLARELWEDGKQLAAANYYLEVAGLLKEESEKYEPEGLTQEELENQKLEGLEDAVKYCKRAMKIFEEKESIKQKARTLGLMVECLMGLEEYDVAISKSKKLIEILQSNNDDRIALRDALNTMGNIYFRRGHDMDLARYNDFEHARLYYSQEREILNELPESTKDLERLRQSSNFNLGVIESKFPGSAVIGENYLISAIKGAVSLRMPESERAAWMEFANVRKRRGDFRRALQCLQKELSICRAHNYEDDEKGCLVEIGKIYIELEDFDNALATFGELKKFNNGEEDQYIKAYKRMAVNIRSKKRRIAALPSVSDLATVNARARFHYDLGREQFKADMFQSALVSVEEGLFAIDSADSNVKMPMSEFRVKLLQLKADLLFYMRESSMETLVSLNDQIMADVRLYFENAKKLLEQQLEVYERAQKIYMYFDRTEEGEGYKDLVDQVKKRMKELDPDDNPMDIDSIQNSGDEEESVQTDNSLVDEEPEAAVEKPIIRTLHAALKMDRQDENEIVSVPIRDESCLVEWFIVQTSQKAWEQLGIHPIISRILVNGSSLSKYETLLEVVPAELDRVDAVVTGFEQHSILEYYEKACQRLNTEPSPRLLNAIKSSPSEDELHLGSMGLGAKDCPVLQHVFRYSPRMKSVDLSANLLYNQDVKMIFSFAKLPHHLDLSCNRLTGAIMPFFADQEGASDLLSLNLAFNPLQPNDYNQVYRLLNACPKLEILDLDSCDLELDDELKDIFSSYKPTRIVIAT